MLTVRLLLVDDTPLVLRALGRMLRAIGAEVTEATTVNQAMEALLVGEFELVIADDDLGWGASGVDFLAKVRETRPKTKRVLLSGATPQDLEEQIRRGAVQSFLTKPVDPEALRGLIAWAGTPGP